MFEIQTREKLKKNGCPLCYPSFVETGLPSCYPSELEDGLQNVLERYKAIVSYWISQFHQHDVIFRAQLSDWHRFRLYQKRVRHYYPQKRFSKFLNTVRKRREKHNLEGNVHLRFDVRQQSTLKNWTNFQDYHLQKLENLEKKRKDLKKNYDITMTTKNRDFRKQSLWALQCKLKYSEKEIRLHEILLQWAEQERMAMNINYLMPVEEQNDDRNASSKIGQGADSGSRRKRRMKISLFLDDVKISKVKPKRSTGQVQKRATSRTEATIEDFIMALKSSIHEISRHRQIKSRSHKTEALFCQRRSQRVFKAERFVQSNAESSARPLHKRSSNQTSFKRSQPTSENIITRSGRVSRRPTKWISKWRNSAA